MSELLCKIEDVVCVNTDELVILISLDEEDDEDLPLAA